MKWNGDNLDFEGKRNFRKDLKKKLEDGLKDKGNKFSKAFEIYWKIAKSDGAEIILWDWNKSSGNDDTDQIMSSFIIDARPDWFKKNKMHWQGSGDDKRGWTYHEAKWENGNWIYIGSYFDSTNSWDDWDD